MIIFILCHIQYIALFSLREFQATCSGMTKIKDRDKNNIKGAETIIQDFFGINM